VLIDADLRRPALHRALGVDATLGLFDVAGGAVAFDDALQPAGPGHGGLRLLAAGMRARLLAPTVLTPAAARDIVRCAQHADRSVVIDAPPLNHVPDVLAFIGAVDDVVIAVRLGRTNLRELQDLAELLAHQGVRPAGFVIAGVAGRDYYDYDFT
jgi:Mrp family chromosome partitioning ATPase